MTADVARLWQLDQMFRSQTSHCRPARQPSLRNCDLSEWTPKLLVS